MSKFFTENIELQVDHNAKKFEPNSKDDLYFLGFTLLGEPRLFDTRKLIAIYL